MTKPQPWTFILSEYLDLAFVLRRAGELVVNVRSATEALHCLSHYRPGRIIIDPGCYGAPRVMAYIQKHHPGTEIEVHDQAVERLLAAG